MIQIEGVCATDEFSGYDDDIQAGTITIKNGKLVISDLTLAYSPE